MDFLKKGLFIFFFCSQLAFTQDPSTPVDGNLYIPFAPSFTPMQMEIFPDAKVLLEYNLILRNDRIFSQEDIREIPEIRNRTKNTDILWIDEETLVVLTGNTEKYPHGILGDKIESTGFKVYRKGNLAGQYELPPDRVFETLRPTAADLIPENPGLEIILTSSNSSEGARVDVFSQTGTLLGSSRPIGQGYRWLHLLGAAAFGDTSEISVAVVKTPHIYGLLELLVWDGKSLVKEASLANVSSHQIYSDNLNIALIMNMDDFRGAELLVPSPDFRSLTLIQYTGRRLTEIKGFELPGQISTNVYFDPESLSLWVGLSNGKIINLHG